MRHCRVVLAPVDGRRIRGGGRRRLYVVAAVVELARECKDRGLQGETRSVEGGNRRERQRQRHLRCWLLRLWLGLDAACLSG